MARVLSDIQPSGDVHLGNYLGAIRRWAEEQDRVDGYFCIVDLHAVTVPHEPQQLRDRTLDLATTLFAAGLDPARSTVFVQSHLHEHAELQWLLNCVATMGELGRMVQWKEKSQKQGESVSVGLFDYPVLQAADILLYQADEVPVGEDQRQHIELTRDIAQRFNHRYGEVFNLPRATLPKAGARVMDLQEPTNKMSKSADSPKGTVLLMEDPKRIAKKIRSAVTDSDDPPAITYDREAKAGVSNLLDLWCAVQGGTIADAQAHFADARGYGDLKVAVADAVVEYLRPVQERFRELKDDPGEVMGQLAAGAERAREVASDTLDRAKEAMGFLGIKA